MVDIKDKLYISTFSKDAISLAKEYGVGLEINHTCISENLDDLSKLERDILKDIDGVNHLILHGPFTEIHPAAIDHKIREVGFNRLKDAVKVCEDLNVSKMVVHSGWIPFIYFKSYQVEKASEFFKELVKGKDINLAIENVLEDEPYTMHEMINRIDMDNIKLTLDIGHLNVASNIDVIDWIKCLKSDISHFHLHNNFKDKDSHNSIEDGSMDILKVFETIEEYMIDATYTIEAKDARRSLEFLNKEGII